MFRWRDRYVMLPQSNRCLLKSFSHWVANRIPHCCRVGSRVTWKPLPPSVEIYRTQYIGCPNFINPRDGQKDVQVRLPIETGSYLYLHWLVMFSACNPYTTISYNWRLISSVRTVRSHVLSVCLPACTLQIRSTVPDVFCHCSKFPFQVWHFHLETLNVSSGACTHSITALFLWAT